MIHRYPIKIFVASGSELSEERQETVNVVDKLRKIYPELDLELVKWETYIPYGSYDKDRIQDEINPLLEKCDVILVIFYSLLGRFTLEEYRLAMEKNKKVYVYFKTGFSPNNNAEYDYYGKVIEFKKEIERENKLLYEEYNTKENFNRIIYEDLNKYLSDISKYKEPLKTLTSVQSILYRGSGKYYKALRSPTGRFRYLDISEILLPGTVNKLIDTMVSINTPIEEVNNKKLFGGGQGDGILEQITPGRRRQNSLNILEVLPVLWKMEIKHAVIVGDGGMGKTVSLLQWWKQLLEPGELDKPVPVFIALNELNQVPERKREDFIIASVLNNYVDDDVESLTETDIKKIMKTPLRGGSDFIPSLVLLLDGFNEITVEKRELLLELNHLVEQCPGIQVVITSRYDIRGNFTWGHWNLVRIKELDEDKVEDYLGGKGMSIPELERLQKLLSNPMMLTLYAGSCEVQKNQRDFSYCCFKDKVETSGELLWNFIEAQVAKIPDRVGPDEAQIIFYWFLLKYLLPGLGYEMEKGGLFDFTYTQFHERLDHLCQRFSKDDFLETIPQLFKYEDMLPLGECVDGRARHKRTARLHDIFCNEMHLLVEEGQTMRFLHQDFRNFFAVLHILNEADISLSKGEIPSVFKERILDYFVRRMLGEIEGEHRSKPYLVKDEGWKIDINKENRLHQVLDLCRGKFGEEVGLAVWNIVTIWKELRGELSGVDFSNLDLSSLSLSGVKCSCFYEDRYLAAVFDGSRVHEKNLLPMGHSGRITSALYSTDGEKILSTSHDKTIKEWDSITGQYLKTLVGHSKTVSSAEYSPDGKKIISTSWDKTIKEWDAITGQCMKTLSGHMHFVNSAVYSLDENKILSASWDKIIKEWDAKTGDCVKTLTGHENKVTCALYSPDGKKILSGSEDKTIKEWDAGTGECVKTLTGHSDIVTSAVYSLDGKKILSSSEDNTIKEWDAISGEFLRTLYGHKRGVTSSVYSPDAEKILSASNDHTIKEWDAGTGECVKTLSGQSHEIIGAVCRIDGKKILSYSHDNTIKEWDEETGECLKIFIGHSRIVTSAVYSPDGEKILSASHDHTIKEWNAGTGECIKILAGHTNWIISAVYSRDGEKILSTSRDKTIKEWDAGTGQCMKTLKGHSNIVNSAVYSPDGNKILSASDDRTIKEWDAGTGECIKTLTGHTKRVTRAVYSLDGKKIFSTSDDNTIKEWDATTLKYLKTYSKEYGSLISGYTSNVTNKKLEIKANKIYVPDDSSRGEKKLINIPGLFIQGCSFQKLEKGSQWTDKGLDILRKYHANL
jgi:WD40 repeat protein